jgi:glycosyltransferase involved in cell wall biosynthesis
VPFGIDEEFFQPGMAEEEEDFLLAVGRDRGRDWPTLFEAVRDVDLKVKLLCRPRDIEGFEVPSNVEVLGHVDRFTYRDLVARSQSVLVITRVLGYPSGQSVTLESMAMGKCCVVTETPAMRDYLSPAENAVTVPPGDPGLVRTAIEQVAGDRSLRDQVGRRARQDVDRRFTARQMWARIAEELRAAVGEEG